MNGMKTLVSGGLVAAGLMLGATAVSAMPQGLSGTVDAATPKADVVRLICPPYGPCYRVPGYRYGYGYRRYGYHRPYGYYRPYGYRRFGYGFY